MLLRFKKKLKQLRYFNALYPFTKLPEIKFVIYTKGRTGSTVLTELLNSHPGIFCDNEIFNISETKTKIKFPFVYIKSCSKRASFRRKPVYGFKMKIEQLKNEHDYKNIGKFLKKLESSGWKIIYLRRSNILNHTLSGLLSNKTKVFHLRNGKDFSHEKFTVDCRHLMDVMNYFEQLEKQEEESLTNVSYVNIDYESDLLDNSCHQKTADRVFRYLGLESQPVKTSLTKIIPEKLSNIILNYDELREVVGNSKFRKFLP
ncbi:MAG: hypothetical protein HGGPFJEG_00168 [Ignavibacteria bacterium]|nr:hypothetical protein [Ignavibacteria bacterium]